MYIFVLYRNCVGSLLSLGKEKQNWQKRLGALIVKKLLICGMKLIGNIHFFYVFLIDQHADY